MKRTNLKRSVFLWLGLFIPFLGAIAQTGSIHGVIKDANDVVPFATVQLKSNVMTGTVTDINGAFILHNVPEGKQSVIISCIGYQKMEIAVNVIAGETAKVPVMLTSKAIALDEFVVKSNYSHGQIKALNMKKTAFALMDVTSSDLIGKLPDNNAAEAVQRIPGVSIERDNGEGRYVTVRATPSQWSSNTINGDRLPSAKTSGDLLGNRTVPLDVFPSDFIQYIQVVKSITPDYEGDAIGGAINFITRTAPEKRTLNISLASNYNNQSQRPGYTGKIAYGDRVLNDKLGFMLLASRNQRTYGTQSYEVVYEDKFNSVNELELRNYEGKRTSDGFNLGLEYNITDKTKIFTRGIYSRLIDNEINRKISYFFNKSTNNAEVRWNIVDYKFRTVGGELGLETKLSDKISADFKYSLYEAIAGYNGPKSVNDSLSGYYYANFFQTVKYDGFQQVIDDKGKPISLKFLKGDGPNPDVGDSYNNIQPNIVGGFNSDAFYLDQYVISIRNVKERDNVGQFNLKYDVANNLHLKMGGKFRQKISSYDRAYASYKPLTKAYFTDFVQEKMPVNGGYLTEIGEPYNDVFLFNLPTKESVEDPYGNSVVNINIKFSYSDKTNSAYALNCYAATEDQYAGYLMGTWNASPKLSIIPGFRYEFTDYKITSYSYNRNTKKIGEIVSKNNFGAFLPMIHAIFKPQNSLDIRAAVTRTFARQAFNDIAPYLDINESSLTAKRGNPDLKPTFAINYDLNINKYFGGTNYFGLGLFYKDITDIALVESYEEDFNMSGVTNTYKVTSLLNSDKAALYGFEINWAQKLSMLPGALKGFGYSLNYTYAHSETSMEERGEKVPLINQSPHTANMILYYEKSGVSVRLAGNYRAAFLWELRGSEEQDRYQDSEFQLDLSASYAIPKTKLVVFSNFTNLTNQPLRYYRGDVNHPEQLEYYSFSAKLGINWNF